MDENREIAVAQKEALDTSFHRELRSGNWFVPATDIYETQDKVMLIIDMPGVCYDCAHVNIADGELVVTGHVSHGEDEDDYVLYREYDVGHYHRHFGLPESIDRLKIEAVMADGVLLLTMPKEESAKPRRIPIKVGG